MESVSRPDDKENKGNENAHQEMVAYVDVGADMHAPLDTHGLEMNDHDSEFVGVEDMWNRMA